MGRNHLGLTDAQVATILNGSFEGFDEKQRLLLELSDALAATPANVSGELFARLKQNFTDEQLIELAAAAGQENYRARMNRLADVGSDGLYCVLPASPQSTAHGPQ